MLPWGEKPLPLGSGEVTCEGFSRNALRYGVNSAKNY
jgi:hypothetical protein